MNHCDRVVGSASCESVEQFHEARLVGITDRGFVVFHKPVLHSPFAWRIPLSVSTVSSIE
jgi:hypothetical protein